MSIEKKLLTSLFVIFAVIYGLISLVNHYYFRTYALDLGISNHAIFDYAHLRMNTLSMGTTNIEPNFLGDHFSPIVMLYAPFYYVFGSYTLLIIQILSILFGGLGIYRYASLSYKEAYLPLLFVLHFFCIWGIYFALSYDFHNNVIGAMFVPWLIYYHQKNNKKAFLLFFILILLCKENMALWLVFILLGLIIKKRFDGNFNWKNIIKFEVPVLACAVLYFIIIISVIIPSITQGLIVSQLGKYELLGNSLPEIFMTMLKCPGYVLSLFFINPLPSVEFNGIKKELHIMVLVSGGIFLFYRPYYLLMLLPIYAQKLFTSNPIIWGLGQQYSIEFVPILTLCICDALSKLNSSKLKYGIVTACIIMTGYFTYIKIENPTIPWYTKTNVAFYSAQHYKSTFDVKEMHRAMGLLPQDAILSVSPNLAPHLAFRRKIYAYPIIKDAQYLVLMKNSYYLMGKEEYEAWIYKYQHDGIYETIYNQNELYIFKKKELR